MHDKDPDIYPFQDWGSPTGKKYKVILYLLPAISGLSGGTLRIPNSFMTQVSGGRNVVFNTSVLLCIPMIMAGIALNNPKCPFNVLIIAAMLSGVGGGAFASSMSNISFYYPRSKQGFALGINGGIGNLGVSLSQLMVPIFMGQGFGKPPLSETAPAGWPANAGWFWFPLCAFSAILAFFWMSNQPHHGNNTTFTNFLYFYWMEIVAIFASVLGVITLIFTRETPAFTSSPGGQVGHKFLLVLIVAVAEHLFMWFITPAPAKVRVHKQAVIFKDKHTWIMTYLYIMCFGSFIGYSGAFPKLITDLFGYIKVDGCTTDGVFNPELTQDECEALGGSFGKGEITNPNAPNVFAFAWMGAAVGSLIRPIGGTLSDKFGGAKVTMVAIIWCTAAAIAQGILVMKTRELPNPEKNFGWFLFLFLNLFFCTGTMNGSTFRTIGVLFNPEEAGPVLGWSSAIASYGAFIIPAMFGVAIGAGRPETTFFALAGYYFSCGLLNFWYYVLPRNAFYESEHYSGTV
jgi:NNP family nitrate/nitrite transporter-like MFS transporter